MIGTHRLGIRILGAVLCLVCVLTLVLPVNAAVRQPEQLLPEQEEASVKTGLASIVHSNAFAGAQSIGYFENGTKLTVLSEKGNYYKVDCYGMNGYIAKSQVECTEDEEYYVNCRENASDTISLDYIAMPDLILLRHSLLRLAQKQLGTAYVYGGSLPGGFDCSGLMYYLYGKHGYSLHHGSTAQLREGVIVSQDSLQVGDLVFFRNDGETYLTSHVGIYVGDNLMIHSGNKGVCYANLDDPWYADYFVGARRVLNAEPMRIETITTAANSAISGTSALSVRPFTGLPETEE